eukprot:CAMPEP_0198327022 /NCGR_PEP_ID=MMETSP1450-20131203/14388_1 /TAXON_ID=753684 ORGANISM="Madagascaria erythrocladiodes, Strain CCMP3234" /NCGR_SAMPLE_ID=MMETSP1450 /ASSEMBLY_ACC=CAM_ASM_001115 /LENGTH=59 /DNA_ID=CAMNT_0044031035 /DNA_START=18 /DNA_END=194 /DNA_ORIENTATION=+
MAAITLEQLPDLTLIAVLECGRDARLTYEVSRVSRKLRHLVLKHGTGFVVRSADAAPFP